MLEEHMNQLPQHVVRGDVHFLDHSRVIGMSYHDVVGCRSDTMLPPSPPTSAIVSMPNSRAAANPRSTLVQLPSGECQRNIAGGSEVAQLVGEDLVEAFRTGDSGHRRDVSGQ